MSSKEINNDTKPQHYALTTSTNDHISDKIPNTAANTAAHTAANTRLNSINNNDVQANKNTATATTSGNAAGGNAAGGSATTTSGAVVSGIQKKKPPTYTPYIALNKVIPLGFTAKASTNTTINTEHRKKI